MNNLDNMPQQSFLKLAPQNNPYSTDLHPMKRGWARTTQRYCALGRKSGSKTLKEACTLINPGTATAVYIIRSRCELDIKGRFDIWDKPERLAHVVP